ncbi:hypothetical protein [Clostridium estertheticum]|nr:hypothetical protein [Clostridium estertheticum]MBU3186512.1 hypothetical protein [Clostridium estertheticum]
MKDDVGYVGLYKKHKVFFDGLLYTITIGNNMRLAIDERKLGNDLERRG